VTSARTTIATPSATTVTAVSASANAILLTWTDVADETGYRVERSTDGANDWVTIATTAQDVTTHKDADLSSGTTYYYRVFATNAGGDSPPSAVVWATTLGHVIGPTSDDSTSSSAESPSAP
jgi:titin